MPTPYALLKMRWFYIKQNDKSICVLIDVKGVLTVGQLDSGDLVKIHERADLINEELLLSSVVSASVEYMGRGNVKVVFCS